MVEVKLFEIRDARTFIPVMAVRLDPACEAERNLLARTGYGLYPEQQEEYVMLMKLAGGRGSASTDPHDWGSPRTMTVAHDHIRNHWAELHTGAVVDVEFILGESDAPKRSESEDG